MTSTDLTRRAVLAGAGVLCATCAAGCATYSSGGGAPVPAADTGTAPAEPAAPSAAAAPAPAAPERGLAATTDIPVGSGTIFADQGVVVTQPTAGQFKAFGVVCPHQGCQVNEVTDGAISCPVPRQHVRPHRRRPDRRSREVPAGVPPGQRQRRAGGAGLRRRSPPNGTSPGPSHQVGCVELPKLLVDGAQVVGAALTARSRGGGLRAARIVDPSTGLPMTVGREPILPTPTREEPPLPGPGAVLPHGRADQASGRISPSSITW